MPPELTVCRFKRCLLAKATVVSLESKPRSRSTKALQGKIHSDPEDMDDLGELGALGQLTHPGCMTMYGTWHYSVCCVKSVPRDASSGHLGATKMH